MADSDLVHPAKLVNIEDEMKQSYIEYAMSVIVGRALPDVRDGLKPVHRRILYAMNEMGNDWNKSYKKSARIVGNVIGKYHPHGDSAVYDAMVRMAQSFSLRHMLIDGQGNFGSVDGDSPAAMRYTEVRMARIAHELLADLPKETVDFIPNYDGSEHEPAVLPSRIPNLLVNGSSGIAVGMATNIPPHNLSEVIDAILALIDRPELSVIDLMQFVRGPDFPTRACINGSKGIVEAYQTGRGKIYMRARTHIEYVDEVASRIVITELPYQVNKARLQEKIAELVKDKKISGIRELRDESDKDGIRVVVELRRGELAEVLLNNLYQHTQMQTVFGINFVVLDGGKPQLLDLKQLLEAFIRHRHAVVTRRTQYDLRKSRARMHILEGLAVSLANIDPIVELIKAAPTPSVAKERLQATEWKLGMVAEMLKRSDAMVSDGENPPEAQASYRLSAAQAQAILDLKLQRLTGLEQEKILKEYSDILTLIKELQDILATPEKLVAVIKEELTEIKKQYHDDRRTEILVDQLDLSMEDFIKPENVVVTFSHVGYVKSQATDTYRSQRRGGKGKIATRMKAEDYIDKLFVANTHDTLLCFSSIGKVYWLKVYQLPQASRSARGDPIVNLLPLGETETIDAILPISEFLEDKFIVMATASGAIKKCQLSAFSRPRNNGVRAIDLADGNQLVGVELTSGEDHIMLFSSAGKVVRFEESKIRDTGRTARGIRGMRMAPGHHLIALIVLAANDDSTVLTVTENGYGKRTASADYAVKGRGGKGVFSIKTNQRNGNVVGAIAVHQGDEVMLISDQGTLIRTPTDDISVLNRHTQGVTLVKLAKEERLVSLERVAEYEDIETNDKRAGE